MCAGSTIGIARGQRVEIPPRYSKIHFHKNAQFLPRTLVGRLTVGIQGLGLIPRQIPGYAHGLNRGS